jgi:GTPase SAR1 family protein
MECVSITKQSLKTRFTLNIWDVGGQKSLRSYWRNYFESTDGLVWVVDSADKMRLDDCKSELLKLLKEEVRSADCGTLHKFNITV